MDIGALCQPLIITQQSYEFAKIDKTSREYISLTYKLRDCKP